MKMMKRPMKKKGEENQIVDDDDEGNEGRLG